MESSYLIQRLKKRQYPRPNPSDAPLSFLGLFDTFAELDYMGSAEFEFGSVGKTLNAMGEQAKAGKLTAAAISLGEGDVSNQHLWSEERGLRLITPTVPIYIVGPADLSYLTEIEQRVRQFAMDEKRTKERVGLSNSLRPRYAGDTEIIGWLEIDNGFAFFTSYDLFSTFANWLGVEHHIPVPLEPVVPPYPMKGAHSYLRDPASETVRGLPAEVRAKRHPAKSPAVLVPTPEGPQYCFAEDWVLESDAGTQTILRDGPFKNLYKPYHLLAKTQPNSGRTL